MGFYSEFKQFALKGNVIEMAVGIIIGGAFGKIVESLVQDILLPPLGFLIGGVPFNQLKLNLKVGAEDKISIEYGHFLEVSTDFLIVALVIFLIIKGMNHLNARRQKEEEGISKDPEEIILLREIRDSLKEKK
jgi:large conductance mechanosensitive channel